MRASSFVHWTRELHGHAPPTKSRSTSAWRTRTGYTASASASTTTSSVTLPWAHHVYFNFLEVAAPCHSRRRLLGAERFRAILDHVRPQVILCTHGSLNHGFFDLAREHLGPRQRAVRDVLRRAVRQIRFQPALGEPGADLFIGAVPETCAMARFLGMPAERTVIGGFLLNPSFYRPPLTGANAPRTCATAWGWTRKNSRCCSPRASTGRTTTSRSWRRCACNSRARICRSSRCAGANPHELAARGGLGARDNPVAARAGAAAFARDAPAHADGSAVVARPGTGTTSEAIISGCPIIFNTLGGFMPQEWITMRYAQRHEFAATVHGPTSFRRSWRAGRRTRRNTRGSAGISSNAASRRIRATSSNW